MIEELEKKLNSTETIKKALPKIIEAFVAFYGESERKNIEEKFRNLLIIGYCPPREWERILREDEKKESDELIDKFLNNIKIRGFDKEKLKKVIFANEDLMYKNAHNINYYIEYINGDTFAKERAVSFLKEFYPYVTVNNIDELIFKKEFKKIDILIIQYNEIMKWFKRYLDKVKPYKKYSKNCEKLKDALEFKYLKKYIEGIKEYFSDEEMQKIRKNLNSETSYYGLFVSKSKIRNFISFSFDVPSLIESFSEENERILNSDNYSDWKKDSIKRDRVIYFKNLGYNFGEKYEDYINKPIIMEIYPSKEFMEKITKLREDIYTEMMNEYYTSIEEYQVNRRRIEHEEFLDREDSYNAKCYENNGIFVNPNIKKNGDRYISFPILCISMGMVDEYLDHNLIHELNHVYELSLQKVENDEYQVICGWDESKGKIFNEAQNDSTKIVSLKEEQDKRNYELFNEIINELLAQEISEIMHSSGVYIFNNEENAKIGGSGYQKIAFLVKDFYNTYKKEIIESRKNGNIDILFDKIGQENFEMLNELIHVFYDNFKGYEIYQTYNDLKEGMETEKTRIYNDIVSRRDEILSRMREYNEKKSQTI